MKRKCSMLSGLQRIYWWKCVWLIFSISSFEFHCEILWSFNFNKRHLYFCLFNVFSVSVSILWRFNWCSFLFHYSITSKISIKSIFIQLPLADKLHLHVCRIFSKAHKPSINLVISQEKIASLAAGYKSLFIIKSFYVAVHCQNFRLFSLIAFATPTSQHLTKKLQRLIIASHAWNNRRPDSGRCGHPWLFMQLIKPLCKDRLL